MYMNLVGNNIQVYSNLDNDSMVVSKQVDGQIVTSIEPDTAIKKLKRATIGMFMLLLFLLYSIFSIISIFMKSDISNYKPHIFLVLIYIINTYILFVYFHGNKIKKRLQGAINKVSNFYNGYKRVPSLDDLRYIPYISYSMDDTKTILLIHLSNLISLYSVSWIYLIEPLKILSYDSFLYLLGIGIIITIYCLIIGGYFTFYQIIYVNEPTEIELSMAISALKVWEEHERSLLPSMEDVMSLDRHKAIMKYKISFRILNAWRFWYRKISYVK